MKVSCSGCEKLYNVDEAKVASNARLRCIRCGDTFSAVPHVEKESDPGNEAEKPKTEGPKENKKFVVVVAHAEESVCNSAKSILDCSVINVVTTLNGEDTLNTVIKLKPAAVVLDVALPGIYGVVVCERIKNHPELKNTKVILVASIYKKSRFRRKPTSLYGADEYIESESFDQDLADVVCRALTIQRDALSGSKKVEKPEKVHSETEASAGTVGSLSQPAENKKGDASHEKGVRLARIIVADIMLYHRKQIDFDLKSDNIFKVFNAEILEGVKYFEKKLPGLTAKEYILEAFKEILSTNKKTGGHGYEKASGGN